MMGGQMKTMHENELKKTATEININKKRARMLYSYKTGSFQISSWFGYWEFFNFLCAIFLFTIV